MNNQDQCPIKIYKKYAEMRPTGFSEPNNPYYVATTTVHHPLPQEIWFKRNQVGVNKLSSMMKRMVERAGLNPDKKLTNHSARKHLVQKLNDFNVPANQIMQISSHSSKTMKTASNSSVHVSGGFQSIFGAQIHGGTFNIHINQNSETMENIPPARKRLRILESDSDTD